MSGHSAAKLVRVAAPHSIDSSSISIVRPHAAIEELVQHFGVHWVTLPGGGIQKNCPMMGDDNKPK